MKKTAPRGAWRRWCFEQLERADPEECWLWPFHVQSAGYPQVYWRGRDHQATRVMHELAFGYQAPEKLHACHVCDVRRCVNPNHIFYGTDADNLADMRAKGRHAYGSRQGAAKLTDAAVIEIRASDETQTTLARRFGVSQSLISKVRAGKFWTHVKEVPA